MSLEFLNIPGWILPRKDLNSRDKNVYSYLLFRQGSNDHCWPSQETIAQELGISVDTVFRSCKKLAEIGLLIQKTVSDGKKKHNIYSVKTSLSAAGEMAETTEDPATCGVKKTTGKKGSELEENAPASPATCGSVPRRLPGDPPQKADPPPADCGVINTIKPTMNTNNKNTRVSSLLFSKSSGANSFQALQLLNEHLSRCEFAKHRAERNPKFRQHLQDKIADTITKYGFDAMKNTIVTHSHEAKDKSARDDGWGLILHLLRQNNRDRTGRMLRNRWTRKELEEREFQDRRQALIARVRGQKTRHVQGV